MSRGLKRTFGPAAGSPAGGVAVGAAGGAAGGVGGAAGGGDESAAGAPGVAAGASPSGGRRRGLSRREVGGGCSSLMRATKAKFATSAKPKKREGISAHATRHMKEPKTFPRGLRAATPRLS